MFKKISSLRKEICPFLFLFLCQISAILNSTVYGNITHKLFNDHLLVMKEHEGLLHV